MQAVTSWWLGLRFIVRMRFTRIALLAGGLSVAACGGQTAAGDSAAQPVEPQQVLRVSPANEVIRYLEARTKNDPGDFIALNKLADAYLKEFRSAGETAYLTLARRCAEDSLAILPAEQNKAALAALIQVEHSSHNFLAARDHARRLAEIDPERAYVYQLLGDALLELGEYEDAKRAFKKMEELVGLQALTRVGTEQRLARIATLYGRDAEALAHLKRALAIAERPPGTSAETVAFCRWQIGEQYLEAGRFDAARDEFEAVLELVPTYYRAIASLGRLYAATGDLARAIGSFERVTATNPDPGHAAYLGDLLMKTGRREDAERQYALVEEIATADGQRGLYDRELAMFYADRNIKTVEACELSAKQYQTRRDIFGADVYAWSCFKAGRLAEARAAMADALRLGTNDAHLFYHAGMIESAAGNTATARQYLKTALRLNPAFDPIQADVARAELSKQGDR